MADMLAGAHTTAIVPGDKYALGAAGGKKPPSRRIKNARRSRMRRSAVLYVASLMQPIVMTTAVLTGEGGVGAHLARISDGGLGGAPHPPVWGDVAAGGVGARGGRGAGDGAGALDLGAGELLGVGEDAIGVAPLLAPVFNAVLAALKAADEAGTPRDGLMGAAWVGIKLMIEELLGIVLYQNDKM